MKKNANEYKFIDANICENLRNVQNLCDVEDSIDDSVLATIKRRMRKFSERVRVMLKTNVDLRHVYSVANNASLTASQVAAGIVTEMRNKADPLLTWLSWSSFVTSLFLLLIIIRAKYYQNMYETRSRFDNRYITKELLEIDSKRRQEGRKNVLPLHRRERDKYIATTSLRLMQSEKVNWNRSVIFMIITTFKLMIHITADYSLYWVLTLIRHHESRQTPVEESITDLGIKVFGSGFVARFLKSILDALCIPLHPPVSVPSSCLPSPHPPDFRRYMQIGFLILLLWFFALFEPYGLRLRHMIMAHYRPERAEARAMWLYNHLLRTREDDSSPPPTASGNISVNDMVAMMSTWQRNQEETFEKLLHTVLNQSHRSSPPPAQPALGNFASCKARYSGAPDESLAKLLIEEYFLRYGLPRRVVSDNGTQFISSVMQLSMFILGIKQELIPVYHPEANPVERKNRDLKVQLSLLVKTEHRNWPKYLAHVRFAMNSAVCSTTGKTPAFLTFARELRTPYEMHHDLRAILDKENFVPSATPYLRSFIRTLQDIRDRVEKKQDQRKEIGDTARRPMPPYKENDLVLVKTHALSNASKGTTSKFMPKRDGPYRVKRVITPTTFILANLTDDDTVIGKYHSSDLTPFTQTSDTTPIVPKKGTFIKFARRKLHKEHKYNKQNELTFREWLQKRVPFHFLLRILGLGSDDKRCLLCGVREYSRSSHRELIRCTTNKCPGTYCQSCYVDIGCLCTACLLPEDYGDLSDVSMEKGSDENYITNDSEDDFVFNDCRKEKQNEEEIK
ncbi:uncharacterized protein LOC114253105 [Bombyx mandarina]|uniref:Uncharacterized protein LOC114253105 n=1 Tax=Bombyx mandarina TaxID=7092 RepID=A0A6J2KQ37_BOMMA|nr:uncharacterized protein LOC114253105 [Bombyx mandarina]